MGCGLEKPRPRPRGLWPRPRPRGLWPRPRGLWPRPRGVVASLTSLGIIYPRHVWWRNYHNCQYLKNLLFHTIN